MLNDTLKKIIIWIIVLAMVLSLAVGLAALVFSS
jgi:hypothetical protein